MALNTSRFVESLSPAEDLHPVRPRSNAKRPITRCRWAADGSGRRRRPDVLACQAEDRNAQRFKDLSGGSNADN
jgi:hypothetical protein